MQMTEKERIFYEFCENLELPKKDEVNELAYTVPQNLTYKIF